MAISVRGKEFLNKLAALVEEYDVDILAPNDDVCICVDDVEVFTGTLSKGICAKVNNNGRTLRAAAEVK